MINAINHVLKTVVLSFALQIKILYVLLVVKKVSLEQNVTNHFQRLKNVMSLIVILVTVHLVVQQV